MKLNKQPLVSIIIPTYNRDKYLEESIISVVNQTYQNFEILVIDDGSKVNYAEDICKKYRSCNYFFKENGGLSSARNFGIRKAKGTYIAFLDDDDFWKEDKIEKQVKILESKKHINCVHSKAAVVNEGGRLTGNYIGASKNKAYKRSGYVFWNALGVWVVKSPTPLIRKKVFTKDLLFDETIKVGEDIDFYQRMFYRHKVIYIDETLAFYREYDDANRLSIQNDKYLGIEKKMYVNFIKMGVNNPFKLYKIANKLLMCYVNRYNAIFPEKKIKLTFVEKYLLPKQTLKRI